MIKRVCFSILILSICVSVFAELTKETVIDQIEITRDGHIQIRIAYLIIENGIEIAKTYHRYVLSPGESLTGKDSKVIAIANVVWTPEVIQAYKDKQAKKEKMK